MPNKLTIEKLKNSLGKKPAELQTIILAAAVAFWRLRKAYEPLHFLAILSYR